MSETTILNTRSASVDEIRLVNAAILEVIKSGKAVAAAVAAAAVARGLDFARDWSMVDRLIDAQVKLNAIVRGISDNSLVVRISRNDVGKDDVDVFARTASQQISGFPIVALTGGFIVLAALAWKALSVQSEANKIEQTAATVVLDVVGQCKSLPEEDRIACLNKVNALAKTPEQKSWLDKLLVKFGVGAAGFGVGAIVALGLVCWLFFGRK